MPAQNLFHDAVKRGLAKDGWTITHDPLIVEFSGLDWYDDPATERLIAAEKDERQIAVLVKSFLGASVLNDFHTTLGQYLNFRLALDEEQPQRILYLAVPMSTYSGFFIHHLAQIAINRHSIHLVVYDPEAEVLVQWVGSIAFALG